MSQLPTCTECGIELAGNSTDLLCPKCLLGLGLQRAERRHLKVRCPHCHNPVEVVDELPLAEFICPSCDSRFNLLGDETKTLDRTQTRMIGQFELLDCVGTGGFGSVWKARDRELDRIVAVKIPRQSQLAREESEQFFREARAAAQLRHPNIVSVHEIGKVDQQMYIVSDFVDGFTLADFLSVKSLTVREAADLSRVICDALAHAHTRGVVHRDIKPSNILLERTPSTVTVSDLDPRQQPKQQTIDAQVGPLIPHITDFGLARRDSGEITITVDGRILGTPAYMPPEQARGAGHLADARSDIYSLGVVLFEMLTGEKPFRGTSRMLIEQVLHEDAPSPRKLNGAVPKDIETICLKCLEKAPDRRFQTATELSAELARFLHGEPITSRPISRLDRAARWCRRNPRVAGLAAALAAVLLIGIVATSWQWFLAETARQGEQAEREKADSVAFANNQMLVASYLKEGSRLAEQDDPFLALPQYLQALKIDQNPDRIGVHRMRINSLLDRCPQLEQMWFHDGPVLDAAFSPDGKRIAISSTGGQVNVFDVANGTHLFTFVHANAVRKLRFTEDGKSLVCFGSFARQGNDRLNLWNLETGERRMPEVAGFERRNFEDIFIPVGADHFVALQWWGVGRDYYNWELTVFSAEDGSRGQKVCQGDCSNQLPTMLVSGNRSTLAVVTQAQSFIVDAKSLQLSNTKISQGAWPSLSCISHDGSRIALAAGSSIYVQNTITGEVIGRCTRDGPQYLKLGFLQDEDLIRAINQNGRLCRVDYLKNWDGISSRLTPGPMLDHWIAPNFCRLAFVSEWSQQQSVRQSQGLRIWDPVEESLSSYRIYHDGRITKAVFSPNGQRLLTCGEDGVAKLWNLAIPQKLVPPIDYKYFGRVADATYDKDRAVVVAGVKQMGFQVFDVDGTHRTPLRRDHRLDFYQDRSANFYEDIWSLFPELESSPYRVNLRYSSISREQATVEVQCDNQKTAQKIWSWTTEIQPFSTANRNYWVAAFSSDYRKLAIGVRMTRPVGEGRELDYDSTSHVFVFDAASGERQREPIEIKGKIYDLQFADNAARLLMGAESFDRNVYQPYEKPRTTLIQMWDLERNALAFSKTSKSFASVRLSNSGRYFSVASELGATSLHFASDGREVFPAKRLSQSISEVCFNPDDSLFAARLSDSNALPSRVFVWDAATGDAIASGLPFHGNFGFDQENALHIGQYVYPLNEQPISDRASQYSDVLTLQRINSSGKTDALDMAQVKASFESLGEIGSSAVELSKLWNAQNGYRCLKAEKWQEAIGFFNDLESSEPGSWKWKAALAECYFKRDSQSAMASEKLAEAIAISPQEPVLQYFSAEQQVNSKNWVAAASALGQLRLAYDSSTVDYNEAVAWLRAGRIEEFDAVRQRLITELLDERNREREIYMANDDFEAIGLIAELALLAPVHTKNIQALAPKIGKRYDALPEKRKNFPYGEEQIIDVTNQALALIRTERAKEAVDQLTIWIDESERPAKYHLLVSLARAKLHDKANSAVALKMAKQIASYQETVLTWQQQTIDEALILEIESLIAE